MAVYPKGAVGLRPPLTTQSGNMCDVSACLGPYTCVRACAYACLRVHVGGEEGGMLTMMMDCSSLKAVMP